MAARFLNAQQGFLACYFYLLHSLCWCVLAAHAGLVKSCVGLPAQNCHVLRIYTGAAIDAPHL